MSIATKSSETRDEYTFTDEDFRVIAQLVKNKYGLFLQESKRALVYSRLAKRIRALGFNNFREYCKLLGSPAGEAEQSHLLTALTTNVTHFFREKHHFDQLQNEILPTLSQAARSGETVRIWSAACSAGQEAYCLAATVLEVFPEAPRFDFKILATDVDPVVLKKAKKGQYPREERDAIPADRIARMVDPQSVNDGVFAMHHSLRELISFGQLNLMEPWPMRKRFDVIMCRNAAIYFDKSTQMRLWSRFGEILKPGGYLMIGHSERLSGPAAAKFESAGITSYRKTHAN
ncbi:CheR family methyltransferase [Yoonia sediminilitoris]|uniref:Chemotaxis protein methyltransferase n=1 Tax=Yoonia sediminilitoris TaxID=1286148 RepID=A0A2T6KQC4_9RHOB|nr:protein-glutamate O-methyltransferase CheR [Yoonia sediminilitoris]PUB18735.1 CheR-type MCP methyltransferase [Yoonia sediminilitoris]RCW98903.1 CheR-type MCP methyltransferase [Yoonia sediminilitoris]